VIMTTFIFLLNSCSIAKFARYYASTDSSGDVSSGRLDRRFYEKADTSYVIGDLPDTWRRIKIKGGDLAFWNSQDDSTITVNSTCDRNKIKYSLRALSNTLVIGIDEKRLIESAERNISAEISLQRIYDGKISGVPIKISTVVLKKGDCIYDLSYSSTPDNFDKWFSEFNEFVSEFKIMS